jgi:hypothetical protein
MLASFYLNHRILLFSPAGCSGMFALNVHNPSAGEGPARAPMKCMGIAVHPLHSGEGKRQSRCTPFLTSRIAVFGDAHPGRQSCKSAAPAQPARSAARRYPSCFPRTLVLENEVRS